jgi:uncharacterized protein YacL
MLDAIIIILFIVAGAGTGFYSIELLPHPVLDQVSSIEGLRSVVAAFSALIGGIFGLVVQTTYRRLEQQVRQMPLDVLITRGDWLGGRAIGSKPDVSPLISITHPERVWLYQATAGDVV